MKRYAFPRIGSNAETARAVPQRIRSVIEWTIALDMRNDNPCDRVLPLLGPQTTS